LIKRNFCVLLIIDADIFNYYWYWINNLLEVNIMNDKLYKQSQDALEILYESIIELLKNYPNGLSNNDVTSYLGLESDQDGAQKNYLAYSLLGNLMSENIVEKFKDGRSSFYKLKNNDGLSKVYKNK
jgi:hypothetical protein